MEPIPVQQRLWDRPLIDCYKVREWNGCGDTLGQARLRTFMASHAEDWLMTVLLIPCGLNLDNEAVRFAAGLCLGLTLCAPYIDASE